MKVKINCFHCGWHMEVSDRVPEIYDQISRMQGCPNGCSRPSLQKVYSNDVKTPLPKKEEVGG